MINVDSLKIYDDLKATGIPDAQAHAQARAIADSVQVAPKDLQQIRIDFNKESQDIRNDFSSVIEKLELKMDLHFKYTHIIGGGIFLSVIINIFVNWLK